MDLLALLKDTGYTLAPWVIMFLLTLGLSTARALVKEFRAYAAKTPTKLDDAVAKGLEDAVNAVDKSKK